MVPFLSPAIIPWWAHVTVAPDVNNIAVFNNGTSQGFKGFIPIGGQTAPNSGVGAKLPWKNPQNKLKNNIISEVMNNNAPYIKPFWTAKVWIPWYVDSRATSIHQK